MIQQRLFPRDSRQVSEIGLGCWQLGGDWGAITEKAATDILRTALEEGITMLDTADVYGDGRSERLIGEYIRQMDARMFVATKAGRKDLYPDRYSVEGLRQCARNSLRRLQTDSLDLLQLHCIPFDVMKAGSVWEWLRTIKREGLIRRFGASVETVEEGLWCVEHVPDLYSLQVIFNPFRQKPARLLFDRAREKGVGIIVRLPLASGLLSGKFKKETVFAPSDHRNYNADGAAFNVGETFAGLPFAKGVELASSLDGIRAASVPMAQWTLRWILDHPAVTTVIPGASNRSQVRSNAAASTLPPVPGHIHQAVATFYDEEVQPHIRGPY
jgi:aryl-alcohol dehydrogenase-like predicted oxidoreductase